MRLNIIRHAETEYNKIGKIQGSEVDSDLNDHGINQSILFFNYYRNFNFQKIYVSGLKRTYQTVEKFIDIGIPYKKIDDFNEISWGVNQGKNDDLLEYKSLTNSWKNGDLDNKFLKGESPNEMLIRLERGLNLILNDKLKNVLVCIHGRALRILLSKIIDDDLSKMDQYDHSNTGMYVIDFDGKNFKLLESNLKIHL